MPHLDKQLHREGFALQDLTSQSRKHWAAYIFDLAQWCLRNHGRECLKEKRFHKVSRRAMFRLLSKWCTFGKSCHDSGGLSCKAGWATVEWEKAGTGAWRTNWVSGQLPKVKLPVVPHADIQRDEGGLSSDAMEASESDGMPGAIRCRQGVQGKQSPAQAGESGVNISARCWGQRHKGSFSELEFGKRC